MTRTTRISITLSVWMFAASACAPQTPATQTTRSETTVPDDDAAPSIGTGTSNPEAPDSGPVPGPLTNSLPKTPPSLPPIAVPKPASNKSCVAPDVVTAFEKALLQHDESEIDRIVIELGAQRVTREGFFIGRESVHRLGDEYTVKGKQFAVVTHMDSMATPTLQLGKTADGALHHIEPRGRSHQIQLLVCGTNACIRGRGAKIQVLPVAIELQSGESLGPPVQPAYDSWWVFRSYTTPRKCGKPPA